MKMCETCNDLLTGRETRYIEEVPDGIGVTLRHGRTRKSLGSFQPKNLIRDIIEGNAAVCQPCARVAIDLFTGVNAPTDEPLEQAYSAAAVCECGHSINSYHQRGECYHGHGSNRRCGCRNMRLM